MPNWCYTEYYIKSSDENKINALYEALQRTEKMSHPDVSFQHWLGYLLMDLGYSFEEACDTRTIHCRGEIEEYENHKGEILIRTSTAWAPMHDPVRLFVNKYAEGAEIYYTADEPGMEIYYTNDPDTLAESYLIDAWEPENLPECMRGIGYSYYGEEDIRNILQEALDTKEEDIDKLIHDFLCEYGEYCSIHQFEYVPLDE